MLYPLYNTDFTKQIVCSGPTENCCFNTVDTSKDGQGVLRKFPFPAKKDETSDSECSLSSNNNERNPVNEYDDADKNNMKKTWKMINVTNGNTWLSMEKKFHSNHLSAGL